MISRIPPAEDPKDQRHQKIMQHRRIQLQFSANLSSVDYIWQREDTQPH